MHTAEFTKKVVNEAAAKERGMRVVIGTSAQCSEEPAAPQVGLTELISGHLGDDVWMLATF